ncbi:MAG: 2-C-methyl-D-erythritol 4-phosphate cytidylyltransferase [Parcubacteria group bacterium CG11_big_fil_rev_8_21_14_0_20_39_14]|nr:MAG: 2-C-methyl-D-erythritol 4-phosphate cytidylyltransferase [Parcubacteria group bacterium CG11_big_fil_rev_8_21_14_0_20_39_14]PIS35322.1 MAG: 2-C-methyl-D-erythritol 4-phosphate cytidylyltransferase [Parcubacteria group bacterium CG08_land_8_20_14_0_20_38_56]
MNFVILLAAGESRRTGKINKVFYKIKGKPLIFYTILAFEKHPKIKKIILVARRKDFKKTAFLIKKYRFRKIAVIIEGGKERQDSSYCGLGAAEVLGAKKGDLILFHNVSNPLISQKEIFDVIKEGKRYGAALLGQLLKDTLKKVKKNFVKKTIPRQNLWLAQTPQVIEYSLAKKAFKKAQFHATDDVSLVEKIGRKVKMTPCSYRNFKITTKEDLDIIKNLINNGK